MVEVRKYRAVVTDCRGEVVADGVVEVVFDLMLIDHESKACLKVEDRMMNLQSDSRMTEFCGFLHKHSIEFYDYAELVGMAFDVELVCDATRGEIVSTIKDRFLVAPPIMV